MKKIRGRPVSPSSISGAKTLRRWIKSFFALNTSQANGLMVLLPVLLVFTLSEPAWRWWRVRTWAPDPQDLIRLDSLAAAWRMNVSNSDTIVLTAQKTKESFDFDPNTATEEELLRLGFDNKTARRIMSYRSRGGAFRTSEDLLKIYGIDSAFWSVVDAHVKISADFQKRSKGHLHSIDGPRPVRNQQWVTKKSEERFDVNVADTARFEAVRGIGGKLSRRIIKYRSALGGFVHVEQLSEVFGLDSLALSNVVRLAFVAPDFLPDRIDLNDADEGRLDGHPYLSRQEARAIVAYRFQHGRFKSVSDLVLLPMFDDTKVQRLEPYLKIVE
ncbi:MAG: helix-hairpin-helix domain-containing protein [Chryseolinea sp.]